MDGNLLLCAGFASNEMTQMRHLLQSLVMIFLISSCMVVFPQMIFIITFATRFLLGSFASSLLFLSSFVCMHGLRNREA